MNLGAWAPYVGLEEMLSWYALSAEHARELARFNSSDNLDWRVTQATSLWLASYRFADASMAQLALPYHNRDHFATVRASGMAAISMYEQLTGQQQPTAVKLLYDIALYTHDAHHCGSTFRATTPKPALLALPELGTRVSVEWVTALATSRMLAQHGVPLPARLFQTKVHWASTYGGQTDFGKELSIPIPAPTDIWGCTMRASDVRTGNNFAHWLLAGIDVNFGEVPAVPASTIWSEYIAQALDFTEYITHTFDKLDAVAGVPLTQQLGWRDELAHMRACLQQLQTGELPEIAALARKRAQRYGVVLH